MNASAHGVPTPVLHVVKGETVTGADLEFGPAHARFTTPKLDLDALVWSRQEQGPVFDTPLSEIMDVLVATGDRLKRDPDGALAEALARNARTNPLPLDVLERSYASLGSLFNRRSMEFMVDQELGGPDVLDGWRPVQRPSGRPARIHFS